jgi:hypothetical protein
MATLTVSPPPEILPSRTPEFLSVKNVDIKFIHTDLFENFSENSLKGDLSNDTTPTPPLFSLIGRLYMPTLDLSATLSKGSLTQDFRVQVFFHESGSPGPLSIPVVHCKFLRKVAEIFTFFIAGL